MNSIVGIVKELKDNYPVGNTVKEYSDISRKFEDLISRGLIEKRGNQLLSSDERFKHSIVPNR